MMMPRSPPTCSLYCTEEAEEVGSWGSTTTTSTCAPAAAAAATSTSRERETTNTTLFPIADLLSSEMDCPPLDDYVSRLRNRSIDDAARQDAINWILKVRGFYGFRPATAYLAVSYLDRFLSFKTIALQDGGGGWPWQLLSVACLSVAAKMEETQVPLLLDLQVMDPRFVFEPATVQRMELLLMTALGWRMRSVTPFDFLDGLADDRRLSCSRASELALSTLRLLDFVGCRPSAIAAAAILCSGEETGSEFSHLCEAASKVRVDCCRKLMEDYLIDTCPSAARKQVIKRGLVAEEAQVTTTTSMPQSPVAVLDAAACGSCDTQQRSTTTSASEVCGAAAVAGIGAAVSPQQPTSKRRRLGSHEQRVENQCR